jgi:hypothetical protein
VALAGALMAAAGCSNTPTSPSYGDGLMLTADVTVALIRWQNGPTVNDYTLCFDLDYPMQSTDTVTVQRAERTLYAADGSVMFHTVDHDLLHEKFGYHGSGGLSGCTGLFSDLDVTRPPATRFRWLIEYTYDRGAYGRQVLNVEGPVVSRRF